jgi:23S rRNA pseudouridine2605 synthase
MRLQKYLAQAGCASRRRSEDIIREGRVRVNGTIVQEMGHIVGDSDIVELDGKALSLTQENIYLMLNKPYGIISSCKDDRGRKTVIDLAGPSHARLFPVGRLDWDTEGLIILTNDGELAHTITHPSKNVTKTYLVHVREKLSGEEMEQLSSGILIDGQQTAPAMLRRAGSITGGHAYQISIHEGRNRQVRKMFEAIGKDVIYLKRLCIGDLCLGDLRQGETRPLTAAEVDYLLSFK